MKRRKEYELEEEDDALALERTLLGVDLHHLHNFVHNLLVRCACTELGVGLES